MHFHFDMFILISPKIPKNTVNIVLCTLVYMCGVCDDAGPARQLTKQALRKPVVERLAGQQDEEVEYIVNFLMKDSVQQALGHYIESLKKPKQ